jgi:hypothetical protein
MRTPLKQPVAADLDYVDVDYIQPSAGYSVSTWACAVKKRANFELTVDAIMREGIYSEDESFFIPPSAIIKIRNRKEKS